MKYAVLMALLVVACIAGCVPSVHGIAASDNIVWDEELLGRWGDPNATDPNAEVWQFEKGDDKGMYRLTHYDNRGRAGSFSVYLVQLGDVLFMDIYPGDKTVEALNDLSQMHLVPAHTFMKVDTIGAELGMRFMDPDHVKDLLADDPALVKHEVTGDDGQGVVLTAGSAELQEFLLKYVDKVFGDKDGSHLKKL